MKINSVGFYNQNHTPNMTFQTKGIPMFNVGNHTNVISRGITSDQISFTAAPVFFLKNIVNIPCPCCGIKMVTGNDFIKLNEDVLCHSSEKAVKALARFEDCMRPTEKACFKEIKAISKKNPLKTLSEILLSARAEHLEKLKKTQFEIFDKLEEKSATLSKETHKKVVNATSYAREMILDEKAIVPFRRKGLITIIRNLQNHIAEKDAAEELLKIAESLPSAGGDLDSFVVKYSARGSKEIGQRLVSSAVGTTEHVKPRTLGGESRDKNYLLECGGCNSYKDDILLHEQVKRNPQMVDNIQKYIDVVIEKINCGVIKDYDWYPSEIAKTVERESKGLLRLDTSKSNYVPTEDTDVILLANKFNSNNHKKSLDGTTKPNNAAQGQKSATSPQEKSKFAEKNLPKEATNPFTKKGRPNRHNHPVKKNQTAQNNENKIVKNNDSSESKLVVKRHESTQKDDSILLQMINKMNNGSGSNLFSE